MQQISKKIILNAIALFVFAVAIQAAPIVRKAAGADAAAIQTAVDQFRADLGGALNPNNTNSFPTGRREINWDGIPDALSSPNNLPANFFNSNSPHGRRFWDSLRSGPVPGECECCKPDQYTRPLRRTRPELRDHVHDVFTAAAVHGDQQPDIPVQHCID